MRHLLSLFCLLCATSLSAVELPPPADDIVLTVTGNITHTNGDGMARFDRAMIDALPQHETRTATPWHDGTRTFSGPLASDLLDAVGAMGGTLRVVALNDYSSEVPVEDLRTYPVILATHMDGQRLSVRDKGPFFLIYPFDAEPQLFNEVYFGRSVWQIVRIDVLE